MTIENISDTARWVAVYRAMETGRPEKAWGKKLSESGAPFLFGPSEGTEFFRPHGWHEAQYRSLLEEAYRLHRTMKGAWLGRLIGRLSPKRVREGWLRFSGFVLLERD